MGSDAVLYILAYANCHTMMRVIYGPCLKELAFAQFFNNASLILRIDTLMLDVAERSVFPRPMVVLKS